MSDDATPLIAVSIVNWNTGALTLRCLQMMRTASYRNFRVVVVDNASQDDSVARIRSEFPDAAIVQSAQNPGFAGGHELGYFRALEWGAAAIWLLNSDAEPDAEALAHLVAAWQLHGDAIYGAAPLSRDADGEVVLNFPAKYLDLNARPRALQRDAAIVFDADWQLRAPLPVGAVVGSSLLLPMSLVQSNGWMDAVWFLYCEEIDYCYRLRRSGVRCYLVPRSRVWHRGGGSHRNRPRVEDVIHYYRARNEIALARRHAGPVTAALIAVKKILRGASSGLRRPRRGWLIWLGVRDALIGRMGKTLAPEAALNDGNPATRIRRWAGSLRGYLNRRALRIESLHRVQLACNPAHTIFIRHYYLYCVALFRQRLSTLDTPLNVIFGDYTVDFGNAHPTRRIDIQHEHTLVKPGGRDSAGAVVGSTPVTGSDAHYLVRIERYEYLRQLDAIIEYSAPNIAHIAASGLFEDYLRRNVQIAPLLYDFDPATGQRSGNMIALFSDFGQPRRGAFLQQARSARLPLRRIKRLFDGEQLRSLYRNTKLLVNVHQTDDHHTFEELRVLPALLCGVIVVSEDVPLKEHIPYARFVIWSRYDDLVDTLRSVHEHYAEHWQRIFGDPELAAILAQMRQRNIDQVDVAVSRIV
jgi:GT2 family glycosyltransferase